MAYNREWDRGRDPWQDNNSWNDYGGGKGHRREEDHHGEGKRRKFNDGGYDAAHGYGEAGPSGAYGQDRGFKKRLVPSEPSPHVIFLGLDQDFTEADLQTFLKSHGCSIETVTIIRDRSTGVSKGFGFAQFTSTEHARAFVGPLFPFVQVPPPASHGASASAAFYKAIETGVPHNGRKVKIDYSQSANPHDRSRRQNLNDGTRDIGNSQAPVLLFRGLDPLSGPQAISQALKVCAGPGKDGAKGMKRIIVIKDKVTMASFGFAFVEFVDVQSASAVLAATMSPKLHPSGFRISERPVAASFAHPYSFQPVTDFLHRDEACLASSTSLGGEEGSWVRYWDESSSCAVLEFKVEEPPPAAVASKEVKKEKEKKEKKKKDTSAAPAILPPTALPMSDKPVTLKLGKGIGFNKQQADESTTPTAPTLLGFGDDDASEDGEGGTDQASNGGDSKVAAAKKVAPLIASKKVVNNITKWTQIQEELSSDIPSTPDVIPAPVPPASTSMIASTPTPGPLPEQEMDLEFSDTRAMTCLLCARQFKTLDQLKRHNKESDLHKKNYKDTNLREVARQKVEAARKAEQQPKYRDRASERRIMHNQPEVPTLATTEKEKRKHQHEEAVKEPPPALHLNPGEDSSNVGNKLLKRMGWQEGSGLGTSGEGRVEPVQTAIYAQGAGIGASKGREVGKFTEGHSGYVDIAKDVARQRYGS